jgi:hypothetical protein
LDSTGRLTTDVWLQSGVAYKVQLTDSLANQIWIEDNITGIGDTGSSGAVTSEWISSGFVPTYSSGGNVFTTPGNSTGTFQVGRRVQVFGNNFGYLYGTVASATGAGPTTVTLTLDSGVMDSSLSAANVGLLGESNPSIPQIVPYNNIGFRAHRSTNQTSGTTLIFDTIDTQTGGTNYNNSTGIFTAPFTGVYLFAANVGFLNNSGSNAAGALNILTGGNVIGASGTIAQIFPTATSFAFSASGVITLTAGQTVSVTSFVTLSANYYAYSATQGTQFSGFLLNRTA